MGKYWRKWGHKTYLSLITVNQYWVIFFIVNYLQDRDHSLDGDGLLLGALHEDVTMANAIGLHERNKSLGHFLVHQGAIGLLVLSMPSSSRKDLHDSLETQFLKKRIVGLLRVTAPVNTGDNGTKIEGLARGGLLHIILGPDTLGERGGNRHL